MTLFVRFGLLLIHILHRTSNVVDGYIQDSICALESSATVFVVCTVHETSYASNTFLDKGALFSLFMMNLFLKVRHFLLKVPFSSAHRYLTHSFHFTITEDEYLTNLYFKCFSIFYR